MTLASLVGLDRSCPCYAAVDAICDYYTHLDRRPVKAEVEPGYLLAQLPGEAPQTGQPFPSIARDFQRLILPGITHWQHPSFFAYFPAISTFESMLGDLYAASVSNPGFNWVCSPACTELEQVVMDWMAKILGLHPSFHIGSGKGGGIISVRWSNISPVGDVTRLKSREPLQKQLSQLQWRPGKGLYGISATVLTSPGMDAVPGSPISNEVREKWSQKLVMYGSTQTHSIAAKAARLLGLRFRAVHVTAADGYALRGDALREAIEADVATDLVPFFVVATIGTTSTGAVDHIADIGQVLNSYPTAFLHVDAAWAGMAYALPEYRAKLRLDEVNTYAHSFCANAHKWGLVGFDYSLFYIRDRKDLTEALDVTPAFLRSKEGDSGIVIDYRNWQLALGRRFRNVKLWFVLRSYGVDGLQKHLRSGIHHCRKLADRIRSSKDFKLVAEPSLSLLVFRLQPQGYEGGEDDDLNRLNKTLHERLMARSDVFLTRTVIKTEEGEMTCIRFAMGGLKTTLECVNATWDVVEQEGAAVFAKDE
ncbi:hypothetical protein TREMEDRAFT_70540 [Tremella mesenterica DSM 1558]|uniref:uncharacterized protein n=1 Tax=Tremella mesenterica (strain ATCC 24925 / CBS 8224 / DSM 1558 / NBRC 9311 / NRRL Y-6157 / RJB 2259-6 / UBC 559-6) TaxID=578456 RepID=UPI00032B9B24|nr:uncharacterized protein TREMEDRAFT_70540 [Tremella mesenterica DSM 1558]EIW65462.1 hypothetical protein TREMEDRAFT_70540 [Tremella mesenterica DSM 1558]